MQHPDICCIDTIEDVIHHEVLQSVALQRVAVRTSGVLAHTRSRSDGLERAFIPAYGACESYEIVNLVNGNARASYADCPLRLFMRDFSGENTAVKAVFLLRKSLMPGGLSF